MSFIFDDIGSWPLPETEILESDGLENLRRKLLLQSCNQETSYIERIEKAMRQKIDSGIECPTYPQFLDMNEQFLVCMRDSSFYEHENPYTVKNSAAKIPELNMIEEASEYFYKSQKKKLPLRVCITGPVELAFNEFGTYIDSELLINISKSVNRFVLNSQKGGKHFFVRVISIDEPSVGLVDFQINRGIILEAWNIATKGCKVDVQIHLHSPVEYRTACQVDNVNVIGVETAANPDNLFIIEKKSLEDYDKFLRVGISRTDIDNMAAEYRKQTGIEVYEDPNGLLKMLDRKEHPQVIQKRLEKAYERFGIRIRYVGPDCGLGGFRSTENAMKLLRNTAAGIETFRKKKGISSVGGAI